MTPDCNRCKEITAFEATIDILANALEEKVTEMCLPVAERNNERWRSFAWWCRLPLIGDYIFNYFKTPRTLERTPVYSHEQWYRDDRAIIEREAQKLEATKAAHMEHWGDEIVTPMDASDPAGYHTPYYATRKDCYAHGLTPFEPNKFDFHSAAGTRRIATVQLVFCSRTKQLVPLANCNWAWSATDGIKFWVKAPTIFPPSATPSHPGFNEWRGNDYYQGRHPRDLERASTI